MANNGLISVKIASPEKAVFKGNVVSVVIPAKAGRVELIPRRAPMIAMLSVGVVQVEEGSSKRAFFIEGGIVEIKDDNCIILTNSVMELRKGGRNRMEIAALLTEYKKDLKGARNKIEKRIMRDHIKYAEMILDTMDKMKNPN